MLVYFMAIWSFFAATWYILWPFGIFYGYLVHFAPFWSVVPKNLATLVSRQTQKRFRAKKWNKNERKMRATDSRDRA
jgi:hypothetical protein